MGLAEIVATLRADTSDFTAKMGEAKATVSDLGKSGSSNFEKLASVGKAALVGVAGAAVGVGVAAVDFGDKLEASQKSLQAALKPTYTSWDSVSKSVAAAGQEAQKYGDTQADVDSALSMGVISTGSYSKAHQALQLALEVSATTHVSLNTAMTAVDKTYSGSTRLLTQLGIGTSMMARTKLKAISTAISGGHQRSTGAPVRAAGHSRWHDCQRSPNLCGAGDGSSESRNKASQNTLSQDQGSVATTVAVLSNRMGGQAAAAADTFQGRLDAARATGENLAAKLGLVLIPILEDMVNDIENVVTWFDKHKTAAEALGIAIGTLVAGAIAVYIVNVGTRMVQATARAVDSLATLAGKLLGTGTSAEIAGSQLETARAQAETAWRRVCRSGN